MIERRPVVKVGVWLSVCTLAVVAGVWFTSSHGSAGASSTEERSSAGVQTAQGSSSPELRGDAGVPGASDTGSAAPTHASPLDDQRLARARQWVLAHRPPDRPYNELEAETLALLEAASDAGDGSALWQINTGVISILTIRALDADRDGRVTDDEVQAFLDDQMNMPPFSEHPFFENGLNESDSRLALLERARLDLWDTDLDGRLSDEERTAGQRAEFELQIDTLVQQELNAMENAGLFHEEGGREQAEIELRERFAQSPFEAGLASLAMMTAERLVVALRLEDLSLHAREVDFNSNMPLPPDVFQFDANLDGDVDAADMLRYDQAMLDYEQTMLALTEQADVNFLRRRFEAAARAGDLDGDGLLTPGEWDLYIDRLIEERDQRLFLISYDLDGDHTVSQSELTRLLDWHRAGSPRADVNYDGLVDARDLEQALQRYEMLTAASSAD